MSAINAPISSQLEAWCIVRSDGVELATKNCAVVRTNLGRYRIELSAPLALLEMGMQLTVLSSSVGLTMTHRFSDSTDIFKNISTWSAVNGVPLDTDWSAMIWRINLGG